MKNEKLKNILKNKMGACFSYELSPEDKAADSLFKVKQLILLELKKHLIYHENKQNRSFYSRQAIIYIKQEIESVNNALTFQELDNRVLWCKRVPKLVVETDNQYFHY